MKLMRIVCLGLCFALTGCVIGGGGCRWLAPIKTTLTGQLHFRDFPATDGMDHVPILVLDQTTHIYDPAVSHQCLAASEVQLLGVTEFPQSMGENAHIKVRGSLSQATSTHHHTRFLVKVTDFQPVAAVH